MKKFSLFLAVLMVCMSVFAGCAKTGDGKNSPVSVEIQEEQIVDMLKAEEEKSAFDKQLEFIKNFDLENFTCSYDITLDAGEGLWDFVEELSGQGGVADILSQVGLDNLAIKSKFAVKDNRFNLYSDALVNDTSIVAADVVYDGDSKIGYVSVPALSENSLGMNFSEVFEALASEVDFSKAVEAYKDYFYAVIEFYEKHNETELASILATYLNVAKDALGEPLNTGVTEVNFGNFTTSLDTIQYRIGEKEAYNVALALLKQLRNDNEIKTIAKDFFGLFENISKYSEAFGGVYGDDFDVNFEEYYEMFMLELDDAISEMEEYALELEEGVDEIDFYLYFNNDKFCGIEFTGEDEYSKINLKCAYLEEGENIGFVFDSFDGFNSEEGFPIIDYTGVNFYGTKKDNVVDGIIAISDGNLVYEIAVEDFVVNADGTGKGTIAIYGDTLSQLSDGEIPANVGFRLVVDQPSLTEASVAFEVLDYSDVVLSLIVDVSLKEGAETIEVPASYIDAQSEEVASWTEDLVANYPVLIANLAEAGINSDILGLLLN